VLGNSFSSFSRAKVGIKCTVPGSPPGSPPTFSGLASGDKLLDGWNIDIVSGKLAIEPCQAIRVDVTLAAPVCNGSAGCARPTCIIVLTNGAVPARLRVRHREWMLGWSCTDKRICVGDAGSQASTSPPYFQ
jgi:hypothetical protein